MEKKQRLIKLALGFGLIGLLGLLLGLIISIIGYDAFGDECFGLTNHTMSELGNYGHSPFAVALNGGLFFGSLCLVLFCLYSLQLSRSITGAMSFLCLAVSCMTLAGIGLFPVNVYHLHVFMLKWFFIFGCISTLVYLVNQTLTLSASNGRWGWITALLSCISFGIFLFLPLFGLDFTEGNRPFYHEMVLEGVRPTLWWPALLQWISLGCFLLWLAVLLFERLRSLEQS
ncbi:MULTISPECIES: DUF998 domain-containing protein [Shewanella]|jgi:hypothetical membrane protein|uniref:DUF998 domain-containing protein n=1 Tax=Shewanella TaxID=22 RepID=UPI00167210FC|nr:MULTISPECIES: DUF998 domain-containing protein [Shewanella]MBO1272119.1 DUF998 domain-containing protein [Shewanella sp. 4t3-1-2LB]MCL2906578.1 DUF998 domain-containing protein [Shewanella fodinae]GGZ01933.1 DUF998 domain-containing protein [Shewanella fodinae]